MSDIEQLVPSYGTYTARTFYGKNVSAVWGARLIAPADLLWDRQDLKSRDDVSKATLIDWLNGTPAGTGAIKKMQDRLRDGFAFQMGENENSYVIYEDDKGMIVGSRQASYGYIYVTAWIKPACTSTDPTNHQGDTCPVHEDVSAVAA